MALATSTFLVSMRVSTYSRSASCAPASSWQGKEEEKKYKEVKRYVKAGRRQATQLPSQMPTPREGHHLAAHWDCNPCGKAGDVNITKGVGQWVGVT